MKVRVIQGCAGRDFTLYAGETVDLADEHCRDLIARGVVVKLEDVQPPEVRRIERPEPPSREAHGPREGPSHRTTVGPGRRRATG